MSPEETRCHMSPSLNYPPRAPLEAVGEAGLGAAGVLLSKAQGGLHRGRVWLSRVLMISEPFLILSSVWGF